MKVNKFKKVIISNALLVLLFYHRPTGSSRQFVTQELPILYLLGVMAIVLIGKVHGELAPGQSNGVAVGCLREGKMIFRGDAD